MLYELKKFCLAACIGTLLGLSVGIIPASLASGLVYKAGRDAFISEYEESHSKINNKTQRVQLEKFADAEASVFLSEQLPIILFLTLTSCGLIGLFAGICRIKIEAEQSQHVLSL